MRSLAGRSLNAGSWIVIGIRLTKVFNNAELGSSVVAQIILTLAE